MKHLPLLAALALGLVAHAPDASAQTGFKLKNRSSFSSNRVTRDPFWPIGWTKQSGAPAESAAPVKAEDFVVSTIMIDQGTPLAVINGKVYGEGETMSLIAGGAKVSVVVAAIEDGRVVLRHQGATITAPLRRK